MRFLVVLVIMLALLITGCIKYGVTNTQKGGGSGDAATTGLAQTPGGLPSLPASAPLSQSGSTSSQPSTSGSGVGELQNPKGSGQQAGLGSLPSMQGSGQSGSLGGFNPPGSSTIPAGTPVSSDMASFKKPYPYHPYKNGIKAIEADKKVVSPGEAVFLMCDIENATSIIVNDSEGRKFDVPVTKRGLFVVPMKTTTYTVTASNPAGSISESLTVTVEFMDVGLYDNSGKLLPEFTTLRVLRNRIKPGETTWLFWNTRSADDVYIWDSLAGKGSFDAMEEWARKEKVEERFRASLWGEREIQPPADVTFLGTGTNKNKKVEYACSVLVTP